VKAGGKVKPRQDAWLEQWRQLAAVTTGIDKSDPRFQPVRDALDRCDTAYLSGDWLTFQQIAEGVKRIARGRE
jgi:hypothetical protein